MLTKRSVIFVRGCRSRCVDVDVDGDAVDGDVLAAEEHE